MAETNQTSNTPNGEQPVTIIKGKPKVVEIDIDNDKINKEADTRFEKEMGDWTPIKRGQPFEDYIQPESSEFKTDLTSDELDRIGRHYKSEDTNKILTDSQSAWEQLGNTAGRIATDFVGGTIQGFGAMAELPKSIYDEVKGQDADFNNGLMQLGRDIQEAGKEAMPLYRAEPGKAWDAGSSGWWFEGIESAMSSLQFLLPVGAAVKGAGALSKLAAAEKILGKLGGNVEKIKYFSKLGVGAVTARNAENMMESYQVRQDVKNNLLQEWENNPQAFEDMKDSKVAKDLEAEGREVDQETLANYIAGKAGWRDYMVNSANVVFDAVQLAPLFKGFDPTIRKSRFGTSTTVKQAQEDALKTGVKYGTLSRVGDYLNPIVSGVGRSLSEGVEEMINDLGAEEGKNYADQLTGKDDSNFGQRLGNFLSSGDNYESAFWGTMGGAVHEAGTKGARKIFDFAKGAKANTDSDYRILEIQNRANIIKDASDKINQVEKNEKISDTEKKEYTNRIKSELALDLGMRAAESGNTEMLVEHIKSPEFRNSLIEQGIAKEEDVDKAIAKTTQDVLVAEDLYKKYYNSFYTAKGDDQVKAMLINQSVTSEFLVKKNTERVNKLNTEIADLKSEDAYMKSTSEPNVETAIHTKALEVAKTALEDFLDSNDLSKDDMLTIKGKAELAKINAEITKNNELMGEQKPTLNGINPQIITKQAETIFANGVNNLNNERIANYRSPETINKLTKVKEEAVKKAKDEVVMDFKSTLDAEIKEGKHTIESLLQLKKDNKASKVKTDYINSKLKEFRATAEKDTKKADVKKAQETVSARDAVKPVKESPTVEDEFAHIPQFEIQEVDEATINPMWKSTIDGLVATKNLEELQGALGVVSTDAMSPTEQYARNKFQELRDELKSATEVVTLNTEVNIGDSTEFEIDEEAQSGIKSSNYSLDNKKSTDDAGTDVSSRLDFYKKTQHEDSTRAYIPQFAPTLENYTSNNFWTVKGGNIVINDDFKDAFKLLIGEELQAGTEIDVSVDIKNPSYNSNKNNLDNVPIKYSYKGITIAYLSTIKALEANIELYKGTPKGDELELELPQNKAIRELFKGVDTIHNSEIFKTKLVYKGNGTVISRGRNKQTALRSIKGISKGLYYRPRATDTKTAVNVEDNTDYFGSTSELRRGVIYMRIDSANGTKMPIPLFVSKVGLKEAAILQKNIDLLLTALNEGKTTEHQEVKDLKDSINQYIKVDTSTQVRDGAPVGFRVFPKGINAEGKATNARIDMTFINKEGTKVNAVIRKDDLGLSTFQLVNKDENGKDVWARNADGSFYKGDVLDVDFREILELKYRNIDYQLLQAKQDYKIEGKTYKSYKDYLVDEEILQTDVAQVLDSDGKVLSNLFGFNNDFSLDISSDLYKEGEQITEVKSDKKVLDDLTDLLMISPYEKEFTVKDSKEKDLTYRENYSIFNKIASTAEQTLEDILKNPMNGNVKVVGKFLKKHIKKNNVTIKVVESLQDNVPALYSSTDNTIYINKQINLSEVLLQQTLLHEIIHAVTVSPIFNNILITKRGADDITRTISDVTDIEFKKYCPQYVKEFVLDMIATKQHIERQLMKKYGKSSERLQKEDTNTFYGLESIQEFISEVMVNPNFRNEIRKLDNGGNFFTKFYNKVIEFLNKVFGIKLPLKETETLKAATIKISNFIDATENIDPLIDLELVHYKKLDKYGNHFSNVEINEIANTVEGLILNVIKSKKLDLQDSFEDLKADDERDVKSLVKSALENYNIKSCPESCQAKMDRVIEFSDTFIDEAINKVNRTFKISGIYDISLIEDTQEITKAWNDSAALEISSQDTVTNQIKMLVQMTPELASLNTTYTEDKTPIWDRQKSTTTGMNKYVDFNIIYPYLIRNLIGARTNAEILGRLDKMSKVTHIDDKGNKTYPFASFAYIAHELTKDSNLLAQFESNLARKNTYDSFIILLNTSEEELEVIIKNEGKDTQANILLANRWLENVDRLIDSLDTPEKKEQFRHEATKEYLKIVALRDNYEEHTEELTNLIYDLSNKLGLELSLGGIEAQLTSSRNWSEVRIIETLDYLIGNIIKGKKADMFGNFNYLAKIEVLFTFDIVENSILSIDGKPLYTIRNPNFISNWFALQKSDSPEGKQEFETLLGNMAKTPDMQLSNWLWNEPHKEGFLNYEIKNNQRVPKLLKAGGLDINKKFLGKFNFHNFGGAKETVTREAQKYGDFSDGDWQLTNVLNYLNEQISVQNKKKEYNAGFVFVPSLIPSDSSNMYLMEIPKVALKKDDYSNNKLNRNTNLYQAVLNTARQEVRRIQQATFEIFDIIDNKLVVRNDVDIKNLQQHYHYGKKIEYNEDGTINLHDTLLDKNNKPKGKAFIFQNMSYKEGDKVITLNDVDGIFTNNHLEVGDVSLAVIDKIRNYTDIFISKMIEKGIKDFKYVEEQITGKHNNIGDGSFQDFITEYVLNQYISNVEQFNFFNGVIAEYKDKVDTNKRAKQMFAPGVALSVENMKIQLEGKSMSDGRSFRAITIADVETQSHTIGFIINSVKNIIITERTYSKEDIKAFNESNLIAGTPKTQLEKDVYKITKGYNKINAGDAQGYVTIDRYEQILRGLGRWNNEYKQIFESIKSGKQLTSTELKTLQPIKGFYYGREYDATLNRFTSNQIKYSTIPLIPQLVAGSQMEKLMDKMNKDGVQEAFFESAHKVGAKMIYKIHNSDGTINDKVLKDIESTTYYNKNWQLQLDVPDHLMDTENLLATQIAKLIIANIDDNTSYTVGGKTMNGKDLKNHYFDILNANIVESADNLLKELGVEKTDTGFKISNVEVQKLLLKEIDKRGLADNYKTAIELNDRGEFNLPLFANNMAYKWEAILTSLFTNRVINQKMPGFSAVLASRLFLDNKMEQSKYEGGIEWSKDKENRTLKSYRDENGIQVVEVLLGAWSKNLYKDGNRVSIDEIPDEIKTMIGYRIPTEKKSSMFVFKVVGFLPDESKGTIITPDDLINQAGWDFDVDKVFSMTKSFYINKKGEFTTYKYNKDNLIKERQELRKEENIFNKTAELLPELNQDIKEEIESDLEDVEDQIKKSVSLKARQNEIFDIYHSILTNPKHMKENFTPSGFDDLISSADEINDIFGEGDNSINPMTEDGQRTFRRRNISGNALKGIAANFNAFGAVAQHTKMQLNDNIAFKFKFNLDNYNKEELEKRYGTSIEFKDNFAYITFKNLGFAPDGSYLNIDGDLILEQGSQGIAAAVDIVKNPTFDTLNATTYTYPAFHTMVLTGVPIRLASMFIRQPIIKKLNDYYFDNKSLLGDNTGNQIETIKRFYQTHLYNELVKLDKNNKITELQRTLEKRQKANVSADTLDKKFLVYVQREDVQRILKYNPDELDVFSVEELKEQLEIASKGLKSVKGEDRIKFYTMQLMVLEYFNKYKKAGEGVQDILQVSKTDGLGAGPSMVITNQLYRKITDLRDNERVLIDAFPAVDKLYPMDGSKSVYSPLETYLTYGNALSVQVLKSLFISQSQSFKRVLKNTETMLKRDLDEDNIKGLNKFLNIYLLQSFNKFKRVNKEEVLGINKEVNDDINVSFDIFKNLSVANKADILKKKNVDYLKEDTQHILNFLLPKLQKDQIEENGYHKLDIVFYKNEFTDDNLADSILRMYESGNEFEKDFAGDLINHTVVANGLTFGLNSAAKTIPNELLISFGLNEHLLQMQQYAERGEIFTGKDINDLYFRNNWNNRDIVPTVKTRWHYNIDEKGNRVIVQDEDGETTTIDDTPVWETDNGILSIPFKKLKNLSNAPYISVYSKEGNKLFKRFEIETEGEFGVTTLNVFESKSEDEKGKEIITKDVFYYQVNKLGKDGITEFDTTSIFEKNNTGLNENDLIAKLEDIIAKRGIKKVNNDLSVDNVDDSTLDDKINSCNY